MKTLKFLFLALFILTSISLSAQISFGIKGGLNLSKLDISSEGNELMSLKLNSKILPGFNAGAFIEYMFNENMGLQSGLAFSTLGCKIKHVEEINLDSKAEFNVKIKFNTVRIPVHFAYKFNLSDNMKLALHTGPYAAYILSGERYSEISLTKEGETIKENNTVDLFKDESETPKRIDAGIGLGVQFEFGKFLIDLTNDFGLVNLVKKSENGKTASTKTNNLQLSLGYRF